MTLSWGKASYNPPNKRTGGEARLSARSAGELRSLAERIRHGDTSAETELVREFTQRIFVMSLVRTHDREIARELVQDVRRLSSVRFARVNCRTRIDWRLSSTAPRGISSRTDCATKANGH